MSYLRDPLTRVQIKTLVDPKKEVPAEIAPEPLQPKPARAVEMIFPEASPTAPGQPQDAAVPDGGAPLLPPGINQVFIPAIRRAGSAETIVYRPAALGGARLSFSRDRINLRKNRDIILAAFITNDPVQVDWDRAKRLAPDLERLDTAPAAGTLFEELPAPAADPKNYTRWSRELVDWLYRNETVELMESRRFKTVSEPGESERDFRVRLQQVAREERDQAMEKLRGRYSSRIATLEDRVRRAEQAVGRHEGQAKQQKMQTAISVGATILGSFLGKSPVSASTLGRATTSARGAGRVAKSQEDVKRAAETLEAQRARLQELEEEFRRETDLLSARMDPQTEELGQLTIKPLKKDIQVRIFTLAWLPYRRSASGIAEPAWGRAESR